VSLQNGLSEELIAQAIGAGRTVGCLVNWAADWVAPGRILHGGHGAFVLGELDGRITPRVRELARLLSAVEETPVTDNIWGYKWAKLIYGALLFGTAVVDAHVYEVVERSAGVQAALVGIVGEGMAASDKAGVRLEAFDEFDPTWYRAALAGDSSACAHAMTAIATHYRAHTKTKTGSWRDLAVRRRETEDDGQRGVTLGPYRPARRHVPPRSHPFLFHDDAPRGARGRARRGRRRYGGGACPRRRHRQARPHRRLRDAGQGMDGAGGGDPRPDLR